MPETETEEEFTPDAKPARQRVSAKASKAETPVASTKVQTESLRRGWSAATEVINASSTYAQALKVEDDTLIIKFLEDDPYASYSRHWVKRNGPDGQTNRPYVCLSSLGQECPLCDVGQKAQAVSAFNVALLTDDGHAALRSWDVGVRNFGVLKKHAKDAKTGPLSKCYYAISKTGKGSKTVYTIVPIRSTDTLQNEHDVIVTPELEAEIEALEMYDSDIVTIPPKKELDEIALELAGGDDYNA